MRVLLGVSGGIAAFKAPSLVRRLREQGHEVRCAMTSAAESFVSPLTLEVLSGHRVYGDEYLSPGGSGEEIHIVAAEWADVVCVAPATAHLLARLALGLGDDFLTTTALAFAGPVLVAPAMHPSMWTKPAVQENVRRLEERGVRFVGPVEGALASGEEGMGRMAEPAAIAATIDGILGDRSLAEWAVVVSAGPTHEPVDPVRFLGNRSSGKMGFAVAAEAARRGAKVSLVAGPVDLATPRGVERIDVETAEEMKEALTSVATDADLIVMAAAVSDYRPAAAAAQKIKKKEGLSEIRLVENPDILAGLAAIAPAALRMGFAAETEMVAARATAKLESKDVDYLVVNDVSRRDIGFGSEHNEVTVYARDGSVTRLERGTKKEVAKRLLDLVAGAGVRAREERVRTRS